jgi:hypothetical protein
MEGFEDNTGMPRIGSITNPKSIGGMTTGDYYRLLTPEEAKEDCYARTCPKCGALYHGLQHFDYCPVCEKPPCTNFISGGTNGA